MISLEQMVEPESMVRIIDAFVDMLDLEQFDFSYFRLNKVRSSALSSLYDDEIYLYGYQNSIRTCRKLEKTYKTNIEIMWMINEQRPHFKTIANFRKDNPKAFKGVFRYFAAILKDWKLMFDQTIKDKLEHNHHKKENYQNIQRHFKETGFGFIMFYLVGFSAIL